MAIPTYNELLVHYKVDSSIMKQTYDDEELREFSLTLDVWETLAKFLGMPNSDIANIKSHGDAVQQRLKMLECWKQRRGSMATYEAMVKALLQISRTDLAERVIILRLSSQDTQKLETTTNLSLSCPSESSKIALTSQARSSATPQLSIHATTSGLVAQNVKLSLRKLEDDFYDLVKFVEATLKKNNIQIDTITRRFSMLPQSIRRRYQTDENYKETRRRILESKSIKKLFDNLTALKHWSYMMPDTLAHILKDVKIDDIHKKIDEYKDKLMAFKANTKLRELIGINFSLPDYCMELTMEVEGWEDKTIQEVENRAVNIVRQAAYSGSPNVSLCLKGAFPGSIKVTFILMESIKLIPKKLLKDKGVVSVQIDGDTFHSKDYSKVTFDNSEVSRRLWGKTATSEYNASGGRDVLILAPDPPHSHPDAVARRAGQLTEEDKLKLQSQGLPPDCQDELDIIEARCKLDRRLQIVGMKSANISRIEIMEYILQLLSTTDNNGALVYYIGAGRRSTGDWCFEDGFITFRDIAELYLRNFKGRVLTIVSDCSYSGCWVRDCMEFLDEQGVQPCGHKAREKGILIKVVTSCKSNEIPTEYCYSISGIYNETNTGMMAFWISKQLLDTQKMASIDSSLLKCNSKTIDEPCTLQHGYTWWKLRAASRLYLVRGKDHGRNTWHYVLLEDDEDTKQNFLDQVAIGKVDKAKYGQVLRSGRGKYPPSEVKDKIEKQFFISYNC